VTHLEPFCPLVDLTTIGIFYWKTRAIAPSAAPSLPYKPLRPRLFTHRDLFQCGRSSRSEGLNAERLPRVSANRARPCCHSSCVTGSQPTRRCGPARSPPACRPGYDDSSCTLAVFFFFWYRRACSGRIHSRRILRPPPLGFSFIFEPELLLFGPPGQALAPSLL